MSDSRLQILLDYLKEDSEDTFTRFAIAMEYRKLGRPEEALAELKGLVTDSPQYVGAYLHLGNLYLESGDLVAAQRVYEKGVRIAEQQRDHHAKSELQAAALNVGDVDPFD